MAKKGSKSSTGNKRSSETVQTETEKSIVNSTETEINSKYNVVRSNQNEVAAKDIKSYDELKGENTTLEEIRDAVRTLPLDNVLPLLYELLAKFDVQQARDTVLTEWIKTILLTHTAYFMKLPNVVQQLSKLYQDLDDRLTVYPKLLAMHGRLDLIQSQIDSRNRRDTEEDEVDSDNEQVGQLYSDTEEELDEEDVDEDDVEEDDEDDLMELDSNDENEMFKEEEQVSDSEDEDDNISDSDLEA